MKKEKREILVDSLPDYVWDKLTVNKKLKTNLKLLQTSSFQEKKYQLFEVLFARLMELIQPEFHWEVTPVQGDEGIDLIGKKQLFHIPNFNIEGYLTILGQCKRRKHYRSSILDDLLGELTRNLYKKNQHMLFLR
jgi:hypothetical protein